MSIYLRSVGTALPGYELPSELMKSKLEEIYGDDPHLVRKLRRVVDSTGVATRRMCAPVEYIERPRRLAETSRSYLEFGVPLAEAAARQALERARVDADQVDLLVVTSCTGVPIPGIDADLVENLGLRRDVTRLPITQMGCAGGAIGLSRAADILRGRGGVALTVSVELPTLTFQRDDRSMANLVSTVIFGDGAAAAVLSTGREGPLEFLASGCYQFPESRYLMGFELADGGFHIVLDKAVPGLIREGFPPVLSRFLAAHDLPSDRLAFHAIHPGGAKILDGIEDALGLPTGGLSESRAALRDVGNLSSATVLFVLERVLRRDDLRPGTTGLLAAFGPGFGAEMQLWKVREA